MDLINNNLFHVTSPIVRLADIFGPFLSVYYIIPQIIHTLKTKDVNGISCHSLYAAMIGNICWVIHSISRHDLLLLATTIIILFLNIIRIYLYNKYSKKNTTMDGTVHSQF